MPENATHEVKDSMVVPTVVVMPTYNERENLSAMLDRIRRAVPEVHVLVVDDGSPDGTGQLADDAAATDEHVHVLHRASKAGLGAAYRAGFAWALEHGFERVGEMDADGSHLPEQLDRLIAALDDGADLAIGSRWVAKGTTVNWPTSRKVISRGGSAYARILLGLRQRDVTGGYRLFRAGTLRAINYDEVLSQGYCFQIELLWRSSQAGLRIAEVPITFVERLNGVSKMSRSIVFEAVWRVALWAVASLPSRLRRSAPRSSAQPD